MKLTIDRGIWLRGEGNDSSRLWRPSDNKMCCVGILALACGLSKRSLRCKPGLGDVRSEEAKELNHLLGARHDLYFINDNPCLNDFEREEALRKEFAKLQIEVEFVG